MHLCLPVREASCFQPTTNGNFPTRGKTTFDLVHDIVFHEMKVNIGRPIQPVREIKCYKKKPIGQT